MGNAEALHDMMKGINIHSVTKLNNTFLGSLSSFVAFCLTRPQKVQ